METTTQEAESIISMFPFVGEKYKEYLRTTAKAVDEKAVFARKEMNAYRQAIRLFYADRDRLVSHAVAKAWQA